jgi:hypothetical protein
MKILRIGACSLSDVRHHQAYTASIAILIVGTVVVLGIWLVQEGASRELKCTTRSYDWQREPRPHHSTDNRDWQQWCRQTYGTAIAGPGMRQRALDWADHCTEAGDAK